MKYFKNGNFYSNPMTKLTLIFTILFLGLFWVTNLFIYFSKMSLTPASVAAYYRGSEANYTLPKTAGAMLEVTHSHLAIMAVVILLLTHLFIFTPFSRKVKIATIVVFFSSALLGEASGWLVRFVHPGFSWLKIISFTALELSMLFVLLAMVKNLLFNNGRTGS